MNYIEKLNKLEKESIRKDSLKLKEGVSVNSRGVMADELGVGVSVFVSESNSDANTIELSTSGVSTTGNTIKLKPTKTFEPYSKEARKYIDNKRTEALNIIKSELDTFQKNVLSKLKKL